MNNPFDRLILRYAAEGPAQKNNAIREAIQEMILYSLSKTDFFVKAGFMGGTNLRLLHGLDRFSEDLDFTLKESDPEFSISEYIPSLETTLRGFGINFVVEEVKKKQINSMKVGVVKASTKELFLRFYPDDRYTDGIYGGELSKIKIEIDTMPARFAGFETVYRTNPFGYMMTSCDMPTMFSGKIHAILCRPWANRFKGRDLYDYIFYLDGGVPYNIRYLNDKLRMSGIIDESLTHQQILQLLGDRFDEIDYKSAIADVVNFIESSEIESVNMWCSEMFKQISSKLHPNE